jgi:hypothetical protein
VELFLIPHVPSCRAPRQLHLHRTQKFHHRLHNSLLLAPNPKPNESSPHAQFLLRSSLMLLPHLHVLFLHGPLPSDLTTKIPHESSFMLRGSIRKCFPCIYFWSFIFRSDKNNPDLIVVVSSYFSTQSPQEGRHLSYSGRSVSILCRQKSVCCVNIHCVTTISTPRPSLNLTLVHAPIILSSSFSFPC